MKTTRLDKLFNFLKASPDDSFLIFAIAKEYETLGQQDLALKYYLELKKVNPKYIGLYYHLGKFYESINEEILALQTYKEGIELAKKLTDFHALSELNTANTNLQIMMGN